MVQPPKKPGESTRHLRAVNASLRDITPEETDLRTRQILMWGTVADCMLDLIDESGDVRRSEAERAERFEKLERERMAAAAENMASLRNTVILAAIATGLSVLLITWVFARAPLQPDLAKRGSSAVEP
jgi:hypothetical protein